MRLPMKAAARARPYGTPPTSWAAPLGQPTISSPVRQRDHVGHRCRPAQNRQHGAGRAERHRTWSMIPHGAPTTWFSASWHSAASRSGSMDPAPRARAVAISSAALDATPTDAGRSDVISTRPRGAVDDPVAHQHERDTDDVVRPSGVCRELPTHLHVVESGQCARARPVRRPPGRRRTPYPGTARPRSPGGSASRAPAPPSSRPRHPGGRVGPAPYPAPKPSTSSASTGPMRAASASLA